MKQETGNMKTSIKRWSLERKRKQYCLFYNMIIIGTIRCSMPPNTRRSIHLIHGSVGDHHGHQEEIGVIELINGVTTQEGAGEEASTSLQKGGKVPRRLHCDQTLPGMQVPGLPEVVKVVIAIITCTDMVMMVMMKMMKEGSEKNHGQNTKG